MAIPATEKGFGIGLGEMPLEDWISILCLHLTAGEVIDAFPDPQHEETGHDNKDRRTDFG